MAQSDNQLDAAEATPKRGRGRPRGSKDRNSRKLVTDTANLIRASPAKSALRRQHSRAWDHAKIALHAVQAARQEFEELENLIMAQLTRPCERVAMVAEAAHAENAE